MNLGNDLINLLRDRHQKSKEFWQISGLLFTFSLFSSTTVASPFFEFHLGNAYTLPADVSIHQAGQATINFNTRFETDGWTMPVYYSIRGGWQGERCHFDLEMIHHKLYGQDLPSEVAHFEITHGLDFFFLNRTCPFQLSEESPFALLNNTHLRLGAGMALANPFTIVRGQRWHEQGGITAPILNEGGYHATGPFLQAGIQKIWPFGFSIETKWVVGWIDVPVVDGNAEFFHQSLHFLFGWRAGKR